MSDIRVRGGSLDVDIVGGVIGGSSPGPVLDATGLTVLPGLIDLQVNGAAGLDVTAQPERLWEVGAALAAYGVTGWLPTVITSEPRARNRALAALSAGPPPDWVGALPLGLHLEGPMIAHDRRGAHPEQWLRPPSLDLVEGWSREAGVTMVTLAPELPGALEVIAALAGRGIVVSVGHTVAGSIDVEAAITAGARCVTHLGNAMAPMLAREPGPVGAAFGGPDLVAGVICDGHHVHDDFLRTAWRTLGPGRFLSVSDTTAALGLPDGATRLGDQEVFVADGTVRLADGTLAGSAASLPACLRVLRTATGCGLDEAVATATTTPAALVGDATRGRISAGLRGDLTLVDDDLTPVVTVVGGVVAYDARAQ
ncbi:MAG: N-acetylglucosamine-6-phosphate deacetylase [Nocardioides sp.]|jgi:N-acetylglucosamine-6-phosphate deacetylase|uniref:N-acetylglucosamine-6-phosphate deacetylase n=1 Tax=Nocardioides sp. TaxID=35761 RepID=UPI00262D752E|nr:amidohydrolase family protein [Nocardioides sp.]MCW2835728.1 N-acetylglucosamine-6-phosphate deacetylase [Nocardioides sp.]